MKKVILHMHMSLDGYIADPTGKIDWWDQNSPDRAFTEEIDTVVMGFSTYRQIVTELHPLSWPYPQWETYVVTKRPIPDYDRIHFRTARDMLCLLPELRQKPGKDIWISGGAATAQLLGDWIDRYHISLEPVLLGGGKRLFGEHTGRVSLKLIGSRTQESVAELIYEKA